VLPGTTLTKGGASVLKFEDSDLEVMSFRSWWKEGSETRFISIKFFLNTEEFEINIDNDDNIYRLKSVQGKYGPASCFDLHIKATLNIFNRKVTLMHCDSETKTWIEANVKRLLKDKKDLEEKLSKYEVISRSSVFESKKPLVEYHLRALLREVGRLKNRLGSFRPTIAARYQV
jgi:hypothetical protein